MEKIFRLLWNLHAFNIVVVFQNDNSGISTKTFLPYNNHKCNDTKPVLINIFWDGKFLHNVGQLFSKSKLKNLHKCPIQVATADNRSYTFVEKMRKGRNQLSGQDIQVITTLSEKLNFSIRFDLIATKTNGSSNAILKAVLTGKADLAIFNLGLRAKNLKLFDATSSYISEKLQLIIPSGKHLTSFEKLVICVVEFKLKFIHNLFIGDDVRIQIEPNFKGTIYYWRNFSILTRSIRERIGSKFASNRWWHFML